MTILPQQPAESEEQSPQPEREQSPQLEEVTPHDEKDSGGANSESTTAILEKSKSTDRLRRNVDTVLKQNNMSLADLESTFSLYICDTGGQVEFQEVLSILINGPAIFFFVIKANVSLGD